MVGAVLDAAGAEVDAEAVVATVGVAVVAVVATVGVAVVAVVATVGVVVTVGVAVAAVVAVGVPVWAGTVVDASSSPSTGSLQAAQNAAHRVKNKGRTTVEALLMVNVDGR
jgi:hypothetical protein